MNENNIEIPKAHLTSEHSAEGSKAHIVAPRHDDVARESHQDSYPYAFGTDGAYAHPVAWDYVLKHTRFKRTHIQAIINVSAIKHIPNSKAVIRFMKFFVPISRVWANADAFFGAKMDRFMPPPSTMPFVAFDSSRPVVTDITSPTVQIDYYASTLFRDSIYYSLHGMVPPIQTGLVVGLVPSRAFRAICNDYLRSKVHRAPYIEFNDDNQNVNGPEKQFLLYHGFANNTQIDINANQQNAQLMRVAASRRYENTFRDITMVLSENNPVDLTSLLTHETTQSFIDEARRRAENAELTDWEIAQQERGGRQATENEVEFINQTTFSIDFSVQLQSIELDANDLAMDGATCYTEHNSSMSDLGYTARKEGLYMIMAVISCPDGFVQSDSRPEIHFRIDRDKFYSKSIAGAVRDASVYQQEVSIGSGANAMNVIGVKRTYSELFENRLHFIRGDYNVLATSGFNAEWNPRINANGWVMPISGTGNLMQINSYADWLLFDNSVESAFFNRNNPLSMRSDYTDCVLSRLLLHDVEIPSSITSGRQRYRRRHRNLMFRVNGVIRVEYDRPCLLEKLTPGDK